MYTVTEFLQFIGAGFFLPLSLFGLYWIMKPKKNTTYYVEAMAEMRSLHLLPPEQFEYRREEELQERVLEYLQMRRSGLRGIATLMVFFYTLCIANFFAEATYAQGNLMLVCMVISVVFTLYAIVLVFVHMLRPIDLQASSYSPDEVALHILHVFITVGLSLTIFF